MLLNLLSDNESMIVAGINFTSGILLFIMSYILSHYSFKAKFSDRSNLKQIFISLSIAFAGLGLHRLWYSIYRIFDKHDYFDFIANHMLENLSSIPALFGMISIVGFISTLAFILNQIFCEKFPFTTIKGSFIAVILFGSVLFTGTTILHNHVETQKSFFLLKHRVTLEKKKEDIENKLKELQKNIDKRL